MLDPVDEAFARLSMLEFALEVVMANQLAHATPESSEKAKVDFVDVMKRPRGVPLTGDVEEGLRTQELCRRSVEMAQRFVEKVSIREAEIRAKLFQDQVSPP